MYPRYFRYSIGLRVESTGKGGDRSIDSLYSRQLLTLLLCWKNEKEWKRKENEIQNVVGEESDENGDVKTKVKCFGNQNRKRDGTRLN